jgi:ATP-binding cassette, subfamily B, bacterial
MRKVFKTFIRMQKPEATAFWVSIVISVLAPLLGSIIAPLYYAKITNSISSKSPYDIVFGLALIYCGCLITQIAIWRIGNWLLVVVQQRTMHRIADHTAHHLFGLSLDFFKDHASGAIVGKHAKFIRGYERIYDEFFFNLIPSIVIFICIMPVVFIKMPLFGGGMIVMGCLFAYMTYKFAKWIQPYNDTLSSASTRMTALLSDQITNMATISAFGIVEEEKEYYSKNNSILSEKRKIAWIKGFIQWSANDLFRAIMTASSVLVTIHLWHIGTFTIGDVILVISYTDTLAQRLANMGNVIKNINQLEADAAEMIDIIEARPTVQDNGTQILPHSCGDIVFTNMNFAFHHSQPLFENFNLTIKKGEKIGIVGETGSGKSTLIKLIMREMDITSGQVEINNINIQDITLRSLKRNMALVPQDPSLFHRTIKENIAIARPDATFEEVVQAAKKARAHGFITKTHSKYGSGYEARVGERGIKLSGGQRQRIAIARVFLANRPFFIFDEATSALDSISESYIQEALQEILEDKNTMICIAHRLSTVAKMDRIIVLEKGVILEQGTHIELLAENGHYATLWNKQLLIEE